MGTRPNLLESSPGSELKQPVHRCCEHCRWRTHLLAAWRDGKNRDRNEHPWPCVLCGPGDPGRDRLR